MSSETSAASRPTTIGDQGIVMSLLRLRAIARQAAFTSVKRGLDKSVEFARAGIGR